MAQMSLEEFARIHHLDQTWIDLRQECNRLVEYQDFWYRRELRDSVRELAAKASDILAAAIKHNGHKGEIYPGRSISSDRTKV